MVAIVLMREVLIALFLHATMCMVAIVLMREVLIACSLHAIELMGRYFVAAVVQVPFFFG